jgi:3-oxoacyl-[acyl-carrier protein] reductase
MQMLKEKNIVITGSNRGIGKATVKVVAEQGANIFACARKPSDEFEAWCRELALQNQVNIYPIYFDFANAEEMRKAFQEIKGITKNVDALVNVAGTVHNANFQMTKQEQLQNLMQINFFSQVQFTQYILKLMTKQRKGSIIRPDCV